MLVNDPVFHRPALAARMADGLLGRDLLRNTGASGLFLAAPRRTGKTTFLKNDLIPAVEALGALAVYVDLWADSSRNPADLVSQAVRDKLAGEGAAWTKPAKGLSRLRKFSGSAKFAGFEAALGFEIDTVGKPEGTTLARAFEGLHKTSAKPIVLIIDEAQHALGSKEGRSTLLALKAARDALNLTSDTPRLAILATGSVRGKLADLVHKKTQAFYGASLDDFPLLGKEFVAHLVRALLSHRMEADKLPDTQSVMEAFKVLGYRPEELRKAIAGAFTRLEADLSDAILAAAREQRQALIADLVARLNGLQDLPRAILNHMACVGDEYRPFSGEAVDRYRQVTVDASLNWARVQKALQWLVRDEFVWQSARGTYGIDDRLLAEYLAEPETTRMLMQPPRASGRKR